LQLVMPVAPWVPARPRRVGASVRNDDGVGVAGGKANTVMSRQQT